MMTSLTLHNVYNSIDFSNNSMTDESSLIIGLYDISIYCSPISTPLRQPRDARVYTFVPVLNVTRKRTTMAESAA